MSIASEIAEGGDVGAARERLHPHVRPDQGEKQKHIHRPEPVEARDDVGVEKISPLGDAFHNFPVLQLAVLLFLGVAAARPAQRNSVHTASPEYTCEREQANVEEYDGPGKVDQCRLVLVARSRFVFWWAVEQFKGHAAADRIRGDTEDRDPVKDSEVLW